ncbi:glutaredoxin-like protein [Leptolyngbya sp. PCC 7375]|nr:glutaredoxin-like protein [Leptolyngbya sp. PCC 7375]
MTISVTKIPTAIAQPVRLYRMVTPDHQCPWGQRAIALLQQKRIEFEDIHLTSSDAVANFKAEHQVPTPPQIFFGDERIGGYSNLASYFDVEAETADYSYTPIIALFSTAGLMALATSLGLSGFMGISLSILASLKLMDLDAFAESFAKYDLITQRLKPYAKVYPMEKQQSSRNIPKCITLSKILFLTNRSRHFSQNMTNQKSQLPLILSVDNA